jgi:hypothetical protein
VTSTRGDAVSMAPKRRHPRIGLWKESEARKFEKLGSVVEGESSDSDTPPEPVEEASQHQPQGDRKWSTIHLQNQLTVRGGLLRVPMVVTTHRTMRNGEMVDYVYLSHTLDWVCRAVQDKSHGHAGLKRTNFLEQLRQKQCEAAGVEYDGDGSVAVAAKNDPMAALLAVGRAVAPEPPAKKARRRCPTNSPVTVSMPRRCAEAYPDDVDDTVIVHLWLKHPKSVWMLSDHIPWALEYMKAQIDLGGVAKISRAAKDKSGKSGSSGGNASVEVPAVAEDSPTWDFSSNAWDMKIHAANGTPVKRCLKPKDLTLEEAGRVSDSPVTDLKQLPYKQLKELARLAMQRWAADLQTPS